MNLKGKAKIEAQRIANYIQTSLKARTRFSAVGKNVYSDRLSSSLSRTGSRFKISELDTGLY